MTPMPPPVPTPELTALLEWVVAGLGELARAGLGPEADAQVARGLALVRRRLTGEYEVDEFGLDVELTTEVMLPLLRPLYERWFRVEVHGAEHIPAGPALIVGNHSGVIPLDALMAQVAVHDNTPTHRILRLLAATLVYEYPGLGMVSRATGGTLACPEDADRLLRTGNLVGVFPEGFKGIGKPFADRYRLQRFGRGGFVASAVRTGAPIVPMAIIGAEETYPMLGDLRPLARLFGTPYFPMTPTFPWLGPVGMIPLPTKWHIEFGEPIPTDGLPDTTVDDPMSMFELGDIVRERIQYQIYGLLSQRRSVFE